MRACKALEALLVDYVAYYEERWLQGKLTACNEKATTERVKHILTAAPQLSRELGGATLHCIIATRLRKDDNDHRVSLKSLISAFEFLELVCVNMFLSPWRKEIKSLKTFTGRFVYSVQSVLPEAELKGILQEIGYTTKTATEFLVTETINEKEKQQIAFQIFLARMECQLLLEMSNNTKTFNCLKLLKERAATLASNDESTPASIKERPVYGLNSNTQKTTRWAVSAHNNPCMNPEVKDSKGGLHFETSTDGMMSTKGKDQSGTTVDETCKENYHMEPSSDSSSKGMNITSSAGLRKNKPTSISQSAVHGNNSKELHRSDSSENTNMDNRDLSLAENKNLDQKGQNFSQSSANSKIVSRVMHLSEQRDNRSQGIQAQKPSNSEGNENIDSKTLNPLKSSENSKMDIHGLNPSKSFDNTMMDKNILNPTMSARNANTYRQERSPSTCAEETMMKKTEVIPCEPKEDTKVATEDNYSFTFNADRTDASKGKSNSSSTGDNRQYHRMGPHLQTSEDRRDIIIMDRAESTVGELNNKGMHTSNLESKIHDPDCATESRDRIHKPQAATSHAAECFHSKRSESEEFLTQYSDLNIAQKPVLKEDSSLQNKKLKENKSRLGVNAAVLEELVTDDPKPLKLHESKSQDFEDHTEAKSKIGKPTKKFEDIQEAYNFTPGKVFSPTDPSNKPPNAESSTTENAPSFCNVPVAEHEASDDEECDLASSFSKLKISEHLEEHLAYQKEKTSNSSATAFKKRSTINGKHAHIDHSTPMFSCSQHNPIAEVDHSSPISFSKVTENTEDTEMDSTSKPCIDALVAEMPLGSYRQVREPPGSTYIPPESLKSQIFNENYNSSYFKLTPQENDEKHSSTDTVPVGDSVFQMNEDCKEGYVVISHHVAPND